MEPDLRGKAALDRRLPIPVLVLRHRRMLTLVFAPVVLAAALSGAAALGVTSTSVQAPLPPPPTEYPCVGAPQLDELPEDGTLLLAIAPPAVTLDPEFHKRPDGTFVVIDVIRASWQRAPEFAEPLCVWVAVRTPGLANYPAAPAMILPARATSLRYQPTGPSGEYCIKIVPLTRTSRGPSEEVCATVRRTKAMWGDRALFAPALRGHRPAGFPTELVAGGLTGFSAVLLAGSALRLRSRTGPSQP